MHGLPIAMQNECLVVILAFAGDHINVRTGNSADRTVPAVADTAVHTTREEIFKVTRKWGIAFAERFRRRKRDGEEIA